MSRRQLERGTPLRGTVGPAGIRRLPGAAEQDGDCSILHIDMDAFYASVEQLRRPEVRGSPLIVGGTGNRGVVSSADYTARTYGVHSAMPMVRALRLCPQAVVLPPDGEEYRRVSQEVAEILRSVTPEVEPLSGDEAFLDVSGSYRRLGSPIRIAELVRERIRAEQGLTCSVGVAATKFVAKLASTHCKPDGMLLVPTEYVHDFLNPLPVGALWGVGERTESALGTLGARTIGDVARIPAQTLRHTLGQAAGDHLAALAAGQDERPVVPTTPEKSIGVEQTFSHDTADPEVIGRELLRLSETAARRLRTEDQAGRTVVVKLRRSDFTTITRSRTLTAPTDVARDINTAARELYLAAGLERTPLRLVGVRVEGLVTASRVSRQLALDEPESGWREAEQTMDHIARKFGTGAVLPATLAEREERDT